MVLRIARMAYLVAVLKQAIDVHIAVNQTTGAVKPLHHIAICTVGVLLVKGCVVDNKIQPRALTIIVFQVSVTTLSSHVARCIVKIVNIGGTGAEAGGYGLSGTLRTERGERVGCKNKNYLILLWIKFASKFFIRMIIL